MLGPTSLEGPQAAQLWWDRRAAPGAGHGTTEAGKEVEAQGDHAEPSEAFPPFPKLQEHLSPELSRNQAAAHPQKGGGREGAQIRWGLAAHGMAVPGRPWGQATAILDKGPGCAHRAPLSVLGWGGAQWAGQGQVGVARPGHGVCVCV